MIQLHLLLLLIQLISHFKCEKKDTKSALTQLSAMNALWLAENIAKLLQAYMTTFAEFEIPHSIHAAFLLYVQLIII